MIAPALRALARRFLYGCFGEHQMVRERIKGRYVLTCQTCGATATFPKQRLRVKRQPATVAQFPRKVKSA